MPVNAYLSHTIPLTQSLPLLERISSSPPHLPQASTKLLERSGAVEATQDRAEAYAQQAADSLNLLPNSDARDALQLLCHKVISRTPLK